MNYKGTLFFPHRLMMFNNCFTLTEYSTWKIVGEAPQPVLTHNTVSQGPCECHPSNFRVEIFCIQILEDISLFLYNGYHPNSSKLELLFSFLLAQTRGPKFLLENYPPFQALADIQDKTYQCGFWTFLPYEINILSNIFC